MGSENSSTSKSVSRQRRERANKGNKLSGIFLFLLFVASLGGGAWYWTQVFIPEREARLYNEETSQISSDLSSRVRELSEWATEETLDAYSAEIRQSAMNEFNQLFSSSIITFDSSTLCFDADKRAPSTAA